MGRFAIPLLELGLPSSPALTSEHLVLRPSDPATYTRGSPTLSQAFSLRLGINHQQTWFSLDFGLELNYTTDFPVSSVCRGHIMGLVRLIITCVNLHNESSLSHMSIYILLVLVFWRTLNNIANQFMTICYSSPKILIQCLYLTFLKSFCYS